MNDKIVHFAPNCHAHVSTLWDFQHRIPVPIAINVPNVPPPWIITFPTLLISSRPRRPYLKCAPFFSFQSILLEMNFKKMQRSKYIPQCTEAAKQSTAGHSNAKTNRKSSFHLGKTAWLLICCIHTSWNGRHFICLIC